MTTTNYGWYVGNVGGDSNTWGISQNATVNSQDTIVFSVQNNNMGTTAPVIKGIGSMWLNTTASPYVLNIYDGTQWVSTGTLDPTGHIFTSIGASTPSIGDMKASMQSGISLWLLCNGAAVSRSTYSALNTLMAAQTPPYPYGNGDGSTTFNVPDLRGQVLAAIGTGTYTGASTRTIGQFVGEETHTLITPEIPSHSHTAGTGGTFVGYNPPNSSLGGASNTNITLFNNTGNTGGDGAHNTMQPTLFAGNYFIYAGV